MVRTKIVLVPYRGIYFLYHRERNDRSRVNYVLVPYRGIYFLYHISKFKQDYGAGKFSSPIGESIFSTFLEKFMATQRHRVLVPYRGIYFLYLVYL